MGLYRSNSSSFIITTTHVEPRATSEEVQEERTGERDGESLRVLSVSFGPEAMSTAVCCIPEAT